MIGKSHEEGEHIQRIERKEYKIAQVVPHIIILHEKYMDQGKAS